MDVLLVVLVLSVVPGPANAEPPAEQLPPISHDPSADVVSSASTLASASPVLSNDATHDFAVASFDDAVDVGAPPAEGGQPASDALQSPAPQPGLIVAHKNANPTEQAQPLPPVAIADGPSSTAQPTADEGRRTVTVPARGRTTITSKSIPTARTAVPWYRNGFVALAAVLAVIFAVAVLARRYVPSVRSMSGGPLKVLSRTHLSPKQSIALVQVGRRLVLVGVSADRMTRLGEITDAEEVFHLTTEATPRGASNAGTAFDEVLQSETARDADEEEPREDPTPTPGRAGQVDETVSRLRDLLGRLRTMQTTTGQSD